MVQRKKVIVHINNVAPEVLDALNEKYPEGYKNHVIKITKPNNDFFHAVPVDLEDVSYLVKIDVKIDNVHQDKLDEQIFSNLESVEPEVKGEDEDDEDEKKSKKSSDDDY